MIINEYQKDILNPKTFDDDLSDLSIFSLRIKEYIEIEREFVDGSLVISLNGEFGSGKSTFIKMWSNEIKQKDKKTIVVNINAWVDDFCGDPLISILSSMIDEFEKQQKKYKTRALTNALKDVAWVTTGALNQIVKHHIGIDVIEVANFAEGKEENRKKKIIHTSNQYNSFLLKKKAIRDINNILENAVKKNNILIFIDELDRCKPDYAISYLETIKHVFNIKGLVFLLSVNRRQLDISAKASFGSELDCTEYFRKFIHREINLPKIQLVNYSRIAENYIRYYLIRDKLRYCVADFDAFTEILITDLLELLAINFRKIQDIFRLIGHAFHSAIKEIKKVPENVTLSVILMCILKIGKNDIYYSLGNSKTRVKEFVNFFSELGMSSLQIWFTLCYTGKGMETEYLSIDNIYNISYLTDYLPDVDWSAVCSHSIEKWGDIEKYNIPYVYTLIEEVSTISPEIDLSML